MFAVMSFWICPNKIYTAGITISPSTVYIVATLLLLIGGLVGFYVGRNSRSRKCPFCEQYMRIERPENLSHKSGYNQMICDDSNPTCPKSTDGPTEVLMGSLNLLSSLWQSDMRSSKVVDYLSPDQMTDLLFAGSNSLRLDDSGEKLQKVHVSTDARTSPRSSAVDLSKPELSNDRQISTPASHSFLSLLSQLQKYSVNTSHPYFFNQLFGSLDPIALAAEIVALSVNTSVYTYETAPVFTLLEKEVMRNIGRLVFANDIDGGDEFVGEGLMIPGGSLANLTAMHAARHRWKVRNGFVRCTGERWCIVEEEKKSDDSIIGGATCVSPNSEMEYQLFENPEPALVAFVSSEAHYSFSKSARVLGIRDEDLIVIPTHEDGKMDVAELAKQIEQLENGVVNNQDKFHEQSRKRIPFFVACTAGSTVRGSFDDIASIVKVCRDYESRVSATHLKTLNYQRTIWVHVDGAWGGSAIFSSRHAVRSVTHMDEVCRADSFTFNPHKMLGAPQQTTAFIVRHRNALRNANAAGAKYLFDPRKNGADYDLGDLSYTCGRRTDAVKLWAMWKYYGKEGLGARVDQKVDELHLFVEVLRKRSSFALACKPWLFNVNFFYFPPRIRGMLANRGVQYSTCVAGDHDSYVQIPDDIAQELANVSVALKLRLHEAGEMIIPYQPLSNQKADCFRLVLAGKKKFDIHDINHVLDTMEKYGHDL